MDRITDDMARARKEADLLQDSLEWSGEVLYEITDDISGVRELRHEVELLASAAAKAEALLAQVAERHTAIATIEKLLERCRELASAAQENGSDFELSASEEESTCRDH